MKHKWSDKQIKVRELVMVNGEDKQRGTWGIGKFGSESCLLEKME